MKIQSSRQHLFSQIPDVQIPRSKFDRSHCLKTTFDAGYLVPVLVDEILPGDTVNLNLQAMVRMATPLKPLMDNLYLDVFFFFVPNRLVWDNWQKFMGERIDTDDDPNDYSIPIMSAPASTGYASGSLYDYMGLPVGVPDFSHSALPIRAYNLIYNEWFRDQNLIDSVVVDRDDSSSSPSDYVLLRRAKRHDYFTSCLPWPQKGDAVLLPLGDSAPVLGIGKETGTFPGTSGTFRVSDGTSDAFAKYAYMDDSIADRQFAVEEKGTTGYPNIRADLSEATAATINELRQAFQVQRLLERDARGGTRYIEIIRAHFGVVSPDARLQRPEYLGGGSNPIVINPVVQTAPKAASGTTTPQGNLAAVGTGHTRCGFAKSFTEHGFIIGLVNVRADLTYQQGLNRMWSRSSRYDHYWPALAHLGEQAVLLKEIYCTGVADDQHDNKIFGYQERYAEYRYFPSQITGLFRSGVSGSLDVWHLAQHFTPTAPALGQDFIEENPPISRVVAVNTEPQFIYDSLVSMISVRPMPVYSVPGLIDHF